MLCRNMLNRLHSIDFTIEGSVSHNCPWGWVHMYTHFVFKKVLYMSDICASLMASVCLVYEDWYLMPSALAGMSKVKMYLFVYGIKHATALVV